MSENDASSALKSEEVVIASNPPPASGLTSKSVHLSPDEMISKLRGLDKAQWARLMRSSEYLTRDDRIMASDLRQIAFVRALEGTRKCRMDWDIVSFLIGIMRSVVSAQWEADKAGNSLTLVANLGTGGLNPPGSTPSPEEAVLSALYDGRLIADIARAISGDAKLESLADAIGDGFRGERLQKRIGVSADELEALRKKLRRILAPMSPRRKK